MTSPRADLLFLAAPPFGGPLFRLVVDRLGRGAAESVLDEAHPDAGWTDRAAALAERFAARPTVVVAHGLAVPAALGAALRTPPAGLVLVNGPVRRLDPITAALAATCATAAGRALVSSTLLRPRLWGPWLRSSAGLRRLVVNPYVMDRDTVAALCEPSVRTSAGRAATAAWFASLRRLPDVRSPGCPVLLLWGDADPLYPASEAAFLESRLPGATYRAVPGGQHLHPEERPWELADRLSVWLTDHGL